VVSRRHCPCACSPSSAPQPGAGGSAGAPGAPPPPERRGEGVKKARRSRRFASWPRPVGDFPAALRFICSNYNVGP
jgi:hypothetical protein